MIARSFSRLAALALSLALAACASQVRLEDPAPVEGQQPDAAAGGTPGQGAGGGGGAGSNPMGSDRTVTQVNVDPLSDPKSPLSRRSVYFDFDSFTIRDEFRPVVDAHARYLLANKGRKVIVQGNTDEKGSREYNLALGQKRAEAVRRALVSLGVPDAQIEAVSLGEEKPKATGGEAAADAENRRADLVYP